jgi:flagellar basal-body rod protein FlgB
VAQKPGGLVEIKVFDRSLDALSRSLDLREQKQVIISGNIANADTPGYQAKQLDFEGALAKALTLDEAPMNRSNHRHMGSGGSVDQVTGEIYNQINNVIREDGNTVDRDSEMFALSENQLLYSASVDLVRKKLALLKYSITDGGGH